MKGTTLEVSYVGSHGVHIPVLADFNQGSTEPVSCDTDRFGLSLAAGSAANRQLHQHPDGTPAGLSHLQLTPDEARAAIQQRDLPDQLLHLVEGVQQCFGRS